MIEDKKITEDVGERAVLVGLITPTQNENKAKEYLAELAFLAETAGAKSEKPFCSVSTTPTLAPLWARANWKRYANILKTTTSTWLSSTTT